MAGNTAPAWPRLLVSTELLGMPSASYYSKAHPEARHCYRERLEVPPACFRARSSLSVAQIISGRFLPLRLAARRSGNF